MREKKILRVRYTFGGVPHQVEVGDEEGLLIPLRQHATV